MKFNPHSMILTCVLGLTAYTNQGFAQCQHPYCNLNVPQAQATAPSDSGPQVVNSRYCYQGNCYPGGYIPGAINAAGNTVADEDFKKALSPAEVLKKELGEIGAAAFTSSYYKPGIVQHIVLFRYKSDVAPEQKKEVVTRFLALKNLAKHSGRNYILSITSGKQNSGEGADQSLEDGFIVTFQSEGDRNYYVGQPVVTDPKFFDPAHQAFKDFVGPLLDQNGALVFDFSVSK